MAPRSDGLDTRQRLLAAAAQAFAERGYRDTTVAQICEAAGANVAAVHYHFGGKDEIYRAVWRDALERSLVRHPRTGGVPGDAPAAERLRGRIRALVEVRFDDGELGYLHCLLSHEVAQPTGLIDEIRREVIGPIRDDLHAILRELLGADATERDLVHCDASIINQCLATRFAPGQRALFFGKDHLERAEIEALAEHVATFSLAGIAAVRQGIEERARPVGRRRVGGAS